jgi:DNA/RNA endonuclease YhcR with UshA esterase domain
MGFIKAGSDVSLDAEFIKSLQGKEIGVVGKVQLYKGKPEIEIDEKAQVV